MANNIFDVPLDYRSPSGGASQMVDGSTTATDWNRVLKTALRNTHTDPKPEMVPMPEPAMSNQDIVKFRGQLLLKLLEIESTRCNAKTEEDERTESLAQVLEGGDHIVSRIQAGMEKYMTLLGIHEGEGPTLSIDEMQRNSIFNHNTSSGTERRVVQMTRSQEELWSSMGRAFSQMNMPMDRVSLMDADINRGGPRSPEDQVTMTFRVLR